jgi:hypothetical protein
VRDRVRERERESVCVCVSYLKHDQRRGFYLPSHLAIGHGTGDGLHSEQQSDLVFSTLLDKYNAIQ